MSDEATRKALEDLVRGYAQAIDGSLGELAEQHAPVFKGQKVGYVLMLFDFGEDGSFAYASNGDRGGHRPLSHGGAREARAAHAVNACMLNECERCGRRWAPMILRPEHADIAAWIIRNSGVAPAGCHICNPDEWTRTGYKPFVSNNENAMRMAGEGHTFLDGRARLRDDIPPHGEPS